MFSRLALAIGANAVNAARSSIPARIMSTTAASITATSALLDITAAAW
jgi:hypothetical protein